MPVQVLVSLQAMVFCPHPFFNEPVYHNKAGSAVVDQQSASYNASIVAGTVQHAILAPLQRPDGHPHGAFKDVLGLHWRAKASAIKAHLAERKSPHLAAVAAALDRL